MAINFGPTYIMQTVGDDGAILEIEEVETYAPETAADLAALLGVDFDDPDFARFAD